MGKRRLDWRTGVAVLLGATALLALASGCSLFSPPEAVTLLDAVTAIYAQHAGMDVPHGVAQQVMAVMLGDEEALVPVEVTDDNYVISPVTGERCMFVTKDGLTKAGIALVKLFMQQRGASP